MTVYFGWYENEFKAMWEAFRLRDLAREQGRAPVKPDEVLFASYGHGDYEGQATVIIEQDGNLFEVYGSHCSCNGLEGQWEPKPVTWGALALRLPELNLYDSRGSGTMRNHTQEARVAFYRLVQRHLGQSEELPPDPSKGPWQDWGITKEEWEDWGHIAFSTAPAEA